MIRDSDCSAAGDGSWKDSSDPPGVIAVAAGAPPPEPGAATDKERREARVPGRLEPPPAAPPAVAPAPEALAVVLCVMCRGVDVAAGVAADEDVWLRDWAVVAAGRSTRGGAAYGRVRHGKPRGLKGGMEVGRGGGAKSAGV